MIRTRAPSASRPSTIWYGVNPRSATLMSRKPDPHSSASVARRSHVAARGLRDCIWRSVHETQSVTEVSGRGLVGETAVQLDVQLAANHQQVGQRLAWSLECRCSERGCLFKLALPGRDHS